MSLQNEANLVGQFRDAVQRGDVAAVRLLLGNMPSLTGHVNDPLFSFGRRAVHAAGANLEMMDLLLDYGADINLRSDWANGPFSVLDAGSEDLARGWDIG